jgi:hypothetical protein
MSKAIENHLFEAGKLAVSAGKAKETAKTKGASAIDHAIVGLLENDTLAHVLEFEVRDQGGNIIEKVKATVADYVAARGFKNGEGKEIRAKVAAYRAAMLSTYFDVKGDQSAGAKAAWTMATRAAKTAIILAGEGISAALVDGKLTLSGGKGDKADALKEAAEKSTNALNKAADGIAGKAKGANERNDETCKETDVDTALQIVAMYAKAIEKGDAAPSGARLSFLRIILSAAPAIKAHDTK